MICFHFQLTYHVYVKRKHATPANIHTEVAWSSLNKWEDTSVSKKASTYILSSLLSDQTGWMSGQTVSLVWHMTGL